MQRTISLLRDLAHDSRENRIWLRPLCGLPLLRGEMTGSYSRPKYYSRFGETFVQGGVSQVRGVPGCSIGG